MTAIVNVITQRISKRINIWTLSAFVVPFVIYAFTVCPTVAILDSAELTTAAVSLGLTRATGYPLYIMLGHLWSRLPLGNYGLRMNLFSAFNGALTILLVHLILRKLRLPNWASFISLGLLATSPYFWGLSLVAEVYTLHTVLLALTILFALLWVDAPTGWRTFWLCLVIGLSMCNHVSSALTLPGLGIYLLIRQPRQVFRPKTILLALFGLAIGLLPYIYLPIRYSAKPAFNYAGLFDADGLFYPVNLHQFKGVWWVASGKVFSTRVGDNWAIIDVTIMMFLRGLWRSFFGIGIGPGLYGIYLMFKKFRGLAVFLCLTFVINVLFFTTYRVIDLETMFLPIYLIFAVWVGFGLNGLFDLINDPSAKPLFRLRDRVFFPRDIFIFALFIFLIFVMVWNWPLVDQSQNTEGYDKAQAIYAQVGQDAVIFGKWTTIPILQYFQIVEGQRPDVKLVNRFLISPANMELWIDREVSTGVRPVYIDYLTPNIVSHYVLGEAGPLYRISN